MKITAVEPILLAIPFGSGGRPWIFGGKPWTNFDVCLVRIETDEGITGWGEAFGRNRDTGLRETIANHLAPQLVGRDPTQINLIKLEFERKFHNFGRIGSLAFGIAAIDIALWDILAKAAGLPLYRLLGGSDLKEVEVYASLMRYGEPAGVARATERALNEGYTSVKLHEIEFDNIKAAFDVAQNGCQIMLDTNCPWTEWEALQMCRRLRDYPVHWLEEPVWPPENFAALAKLRRESGFRIAAGEDAGSLHDFKLMFDAGAVDIAQPDLAKGFGISEVLRIAALADAYNVEVVPHCAMFGPGLAATLHFNAAAWNKPLLERLYIDLEANPLHEAMVPRNGKIEVPQSPGLGFDPDPTVIGKYRIA